MLFWFQPVGVSLTPMVISYPAHLIASALAVICGGIVLVMGLLRIGFIVDFITEVGRLTQHRRNLS
jgi:MFS superfamily sulfate permease-like transporter